MFDVEYSGDTANASLTESRAAESGGSNREPIAFACHGELKV